MMNGFGSILWWPVMAVFGLVGLIIGTLVFVFWIWMIIDCARRHFKNNAEKIAWIIIVVLLGWLGALIYYLVVRISNPYGLRKK